MGSQAVLVGVRGWDKMMSGGREFERGRSVWSIWVEGNGGGRSQHVFCYRAKGESGELDLEEKRKGWRSAVNTPAQCRHVLVNAVCVWGGGACDSAPVHMHVVARAGHLFSSLLLPTLLPWSIFLEGPEVCQLSIKITVWKHQQLEDVSSLFCVLEIHSLTNLPGLALMKFYHRLNFLVTKLIFDCILCKQFLNFEWWYILLPSIW